MPSSYDDLDNSVSSRTESLNKKLTNALLSNDTNEFRKIFQKEGWPRYSEWSDFDLLMLAIKHERKEIVNFLLDSGCRVFKKSNIITPLHLAATKQGWTDVVERLIKAKLRVADKSNYGRGNGNTALHCAFFERFTNLDYTIDLLLTSHLQQWGNNQHGNVLNKDNLSFLHIACTRPNLDIVRVLVEADEDSIYLQESQLLRTPLHFAVEYDRHQIAEYLLKCDADLYNQDSNKSTALHLAFKRRDAQMINLLFSYDKRWKNIVNIFGLSHFMISCAASNIDIVKKYLKNVKNPMDLINAEVKTLGDLTGYTALHIAVDFGRNETVELLVEQEANCCATTIGGFTSHQLAEKQGYNHVSSILQEHCVLMKKYKKLRAESPDFTKWGENYENEVLTQRFQMFDYLDKTLKALSSMSKSAEIT